MAQDTILMKDQLFNAESIGDLARDYERAIPGFDRDAFAARVLAGFPERELLARLDWIADCLEPFLPRSFPLMAEVLEAAMPPPLDPKLTDNDFGRFIHAVPGILAVRHGLEAHVPRALDLLYEATKRFSMEFYIRPFLNTWPEQTLHRLSVWAQDENYHVRRLVSEGTRPKLPWAKAVQLEPAQTVPLLNRLYAEPTRYVTRSVANHMNDLSKSMPDRVIEVLSGWRAEGRQTPKEMDWIMRHALRTRIKAGDPAALRMIGFDPDAPVSVDVDIRTVRVPLGAPVTFDVRLSAPNDLRVLIDYVMYFPTAAGKTRQKTFKFTQANLVAGVEQVFTKQHKLKANASTFTLVPGEHRLDVLVNGHVRAQAAFHLSD